MQRKSLLSRILLLMAVLLTGVGTAWGDEAGFSFKTTTTVPISANAQNLTTTVTGSNKETWTITIAGTFTSSSMQGTSGNKYWQMGKNKSSITSATYSTNGISGTITKIVVNCAGGGAISATVGGAAFGTAGTPPTWSSDKGGDVYFEGSATGEIVITQTPTSNKGCYIQSVTVTYTAAPAKTEPTLTFGKEAYTIGVEGEVTITATSTDSKGSITYSSSNTDVADIDTNTGEVFAYAEGSTTITATIAETDDFAKKSINVTLTVTDDREEAGLAWSESEVKIALHTADGEFVVPTLTNPNNLAVTITSTDNDIATDIDGELLIATEAVGEATVTATFAGNETYKPAKVTTKIVVYDPNVKGTENNPYTVSDIIALEAAPSDPVYVKGYIVGTYNNGGKANFARTGAANTNIALADNADEESVDNTIALQLEKNNFDL